MTQDFPLGQKLRWHGHPYEVMTRNGDQVVLIGTRKGRTTLATVQELQDAMSVGTVKLDGSPTTQLALLPMLRAGTPEGRAIVSYRLQYVRALLSETHRTGDRKQIQRVIDKVSHHTNDANPPSTSAVYRWTRIYQAQQQDPIALLPRHADKGNRAPRFSDEQIDLIEQAIDEHYLSANKPSIEDTHDWLAQLIRRVNQTGTHQPLAVPSYDSMCRWVRERVDPYWKIARREGRAQADRMFRGRGEGVTSTFPLERVEIDHTSLDIIVVNPITKEPIGRPTFTWAMDHFSRVILGFRLSLEPASTVSALVCLQQVLVDKTDTVTELPGLANATWDMFGTPAAIIMDNGPEFHSTNFTQACGRHHINIQYCPPGQPWFKGRAERFARTLNQGLIHLLPGTTFSNPKARGAYRSTSLACLTLNEVDQLIRRWIVAVYHTRRHRTLGASPNQIWIEGVQAHPVPKIAPKHDDLALALHTNATISGGRIQFDNRRYHSTRLLALEMQLGKKRRVEVLYHFHDISRAFVIDPLQKIPIEVPCITPGVTTGMSLDEYRLLRRTAKQQDADRHEPALDEAKQAIQSDVRDMHREAERTANKKYNRKGKQTGLSKKELSRIEQLDSVAVLQEASTEGESTRSRWAAYSDEGAFRTAPPHQGGQRG